MQHESGGGRDRQPAELCYAWLAVLELVASRLPALCLGPFYLLLTAWAWGTAARVAPWYSFALTFGSALVIMVIIALLSERLCEYRRTGVHFSLSTAFLISIPLCIYLAAIQKVLQRLPKAGGELGVWLIIFSTAVGWMVFTTVLLLWFAEALMFVAVGLRRWWVTGYVDPVRDTKETAASEMQGNATDIPRGFLPRQVVIHDYRPNWPAEYEHIQSALQQALGSLALRIDHIGSTSVPGLGAKDVIDVQVTVRDFTSEVIDRFTRAGYQEGTAIRHDHVPVGEVDDPTLWEKRLFKQRKGQRRANIHVRIAGRPNQRYPLLFRDYLRAHPRLVGKVELVKREIAQRHGHDVESYYAIKDPVYDLLWEAAQEWARSSGWNL